MAFFIRVGLVLGLSAFLHSPAVAGDQSIAIAAVAADVQRLIVRSSDGRLASYAKGESIADTDWRLVRVSDRIAVLEAIVPYDGARLEIRAAVGQTIDARVSSPLQTPPLLTVHALHGAPTGEGGR